MRLPLACAALLAAGCAAAAEDDAPGDPRARTPGSDWPCFLGPTHDSVSPEKGVIAPWPREGLRVVWQTLLGEGYAAPAVRDGRLFHFDRHGGRARLTCRDARTGERLWKFEYPTDYEDYYGYNGGPRCCPVVDDDRVYTYGPEGMLHCVRVTDGKLLWKADTKQKFHFYQNFFGVGSTPFVEGELLLVAVGGSPKEPAPRHFRDIRGNGTAIVAFDKKTGEVRYTTSDELAAYASPVVRTINGRRVGLYFARGGLLGFEPATGEELFHFPWQARPVESVNASNPVVVGDEVLITECYGPGAALLKVKPGGCEVIWSDADEPRDKRLQCHWNTPVYHDGYVYGCSGRHTSNAELRCVEWKTGEVMWGKRGMDRGSLLMADGHFLYLGEYGTLRLLKVNPKRYEEVSSWKVPGLDYPCWAAPVLSHGLLYVRGRDRLICLELIPGKK